VRERFRERLVLLTGASAGIGRAAALAFASEGARVIAVARRADRLDALVAEAGTQGSRILPIVADVADAPSMDAMAARVLGDAGVPDVVVANAGVGLDALFHQTTDEALRRVFEVNVLVVRPAVPAGHGPARGGRVLVISRGRAPRLSYSAYRGTSSP
jgi:NAD(P)-dependent dehydrogenase (short-subunit alcohol dehydrogenase family)